MRIRKREKIAPITLMPYDTLSVTWKNEEGETELVKEFAGRHIVVDEAVIFDLEPGELGYEDGIGGFVAKREEK